MTDVIMKAVKDGMDVVASRLDQQDRMITEIAQQQESAPYSNGRGHAGNPFAKAAKDLVAKAANVASRDSKSASVGIDSPLGLMVKSTVVGDTAGTDEDGYAVQAQRDTRLANDPRRPLRLLDVLPRIRVTSNAFEYNALDSYSNAAGYQTNEGSLKPEGSLPTDLKSASIATIAHWIPASRQVLADAPALQQQISSLLRYGVMRKLETEVIAGAGGTGQISGLTDSGNYTAYSLAASGDTLADAVAKAQAVMDAAGWVANLVVVHPNDWRDARKERVDAGAGVYIAGSWRDPAPPSIWGIPVVTNAAVTAGNFLIMDTSQVAILDRQEARVELGYADDDFVRNKVRLLSELRAGLAVFSPGAVMFGDWEA